MGSTPTSGIGPETWDAVVVGAGAAGLAAARQLAAAGWAVVVLEARERIGGRIWTRLAPESAVPVELGAELIHGRPEITLELLREAGSAPVEFAGSHWVARDGELQPMEPLFGQVGEVMRGAGELAAGDVSLEAYLEREPGGARLAAARELTRMLAEGFDAADPARASARALGREWSGEASVEAPQFRPLGGYGRLVGHLARGIGRERSALRLGAVVSEVRWEPGAVEVSGSRLGEPFRLAGRCAVLSVPLGVLQRATGEPGAIGFVPPLAEKAAALAGLASGPVLKVVLRFRSAFWEEVRGGRLRDAAFFHHPAARFPTFWTALPVRAPVLTAWAGGPRAAALSGAAGADIVRQALDSLRGTLGTAAGAEELEGAALHDWQEDPFARGAYSYVAVEGLAAREDLARPVAGTLFFAGEATDTGGQPGTVAGALASGLRAAREALDGRAGGGLRPGGFTPR